MKRIVSPIALLALAAGLVLAGSPVAGAEAIAAPSGEGQTEFVPGEVVVRLAGGPERVLQLPAGVGVADAARALSANERVAYAVPNYIAFKATCAGGFPNDTGVGAEQCGWSNVQWNFLPSCSLPCAGSAGTVSPGGINAPAAWQTLAARGRPGARGVKIAVLDTGVAFKTVKPKFRKSPDFARKQFLPGRDFVKKDKLPADEDGHGTHVAGTIGERTNNRFANTGLAFRAKMIPVRVLNQNGTGTASDISKGIRFAAKAGAKVINMSFQFGPVAQSCHQVKGICGAILFANRHGAVVTSASGNQSTAPVSYPARAAGAIAVGGTTEGGCLAGYSNKGAGLDLVAPGGGRAGTPGCSMIQDERSIIQLTYSGPGFRTFGFPGNYEGTSMSSAHVAGVAAMVVASGVLGPRPSPAAIECQLTHTTRDLGAPGIDAEFGAGLVDAAAAVTARAPAC